MNDLLCEKTHKGIDEKLNNHEQRLGVQADKIDKLENNQVRTEVIVQNLCDQIRALVDTMKTQQTEQYKQQQEQQAAQHKQQQAQLATLLGIAGTAIVILIGFVAWYIQSIPR